MWNFPEAGPRRNSPALRDEWDGAQVLLGFCICYSSYHCDPIPGKKQQEVGRIYTGSQVPRREDSMAPGLLSVAVGTCNPQFFAPQQVMKRGGN